MADPESPFYQEEAFTFMLRKLGTLGTAQLKEKSTKEGQKLVVVINEISSLTQAITILQSLKKPTTV